MPSDKRINRIESEELNRLVFNALFDLTETLPCNIWGIIIKIEAEQNIHLCADTILSALQRLSDERLVIETERGWELC